MMRQNVCDMVRRGMTTLAVLCGATVLIAAATPQADAARIPSPNTSAEITPTTILANGENTPCAIIGFYPKVSRVLVEPSCGIPTRVLMGGYKYLKNGGYSYEQVAARDANKPIPPYTQEEVLVNYGILQPVYIKDHQADGSVGYIVFQIPRVGSVVEIHAHMKE